MQTFQPSGSDNQRFRSLLFNPKTQFDPDSRDNNKFMNNFQGTPSQNKNSNIQKKVQDHFDRTNISDMYKQNYKEFFNENEFYRIYNEKLTKQFQEMLQGKGFSIYQKGLIYADKQHTGLDEILLHSDSISPLLKALEDENSVLKEEIAYLSNDLKRFISMVELLLEENKYIRDHINMKNQDITKLIETIGLNESEDIHDLKNKIQLLEEETNFLRKNVDELLKYKEEYNNLVDENEHEMSRAKEIYQKAKDDLENALNREESLSKQLSSIEPKYQREQEKNEKQEYEIEDLKAQINQCQNEITKLLNENEHYKRNYEELTQKMEMKNDQLQQENHLLNNQYSEARAALKSVEKQLDHFQEEYKKYSRICEKNKQESDKLESIVEDQKGTILIEQARTESSLQREKQMREKLEISLSSTDNALLKLHQVEKQYHALQESSKQEFQEKHARYEEVLKNLQVQSKNQGDEKDEQLKEQTAALKQLKAQLEKSNQESEFKTREINDYKSKLTDYQHQKRIIDAQTLELKQQQNQINELNSLLNDYKVHLQLIPNSESEQEALLQQLQALEDKCLMLEGDNLNNDVVQENDLLKLQNNELNIEKDHTLQQNIELKKEVNLLRNELNAIVNSNLDARIQRQKQSIMHENEKNQGYDKFKTTQQENSRLEEANMELQRQIQMFQRQQGEDPQFTNFQHQQMRYEQESNRSFNRGGGQAQRQDWLKKQ